MELFSKVLIILIFLNLNYFLICTSVPPYIEKHQMQILPVTAGSGGKEPYDGNSKIFIIICLAWVAIAAIAWGFYFGFWREEERVKSLEYPEKLPNEMTCCESKGNQEQSCGKNECLEKSLNAFMCCGSKGNQEKSCGRNECLDKLPIEMCCGSKGNQGQCCGRNEYLEKSPIESICCGSKGNQEQSCGRNECPQKSPNETCCGSKGKPEQSCGRNECSQKSPNETCCGSKGNQGQCCGRNEEEKSNKNKVFSNFFKMSPNRRIPICQNCDKGECKKHCSTCSNPKQQRKWSPCGKTEQNEISYEITDRPSSMSQCSQRIIPENVHFLKKSPNCSIKYDFDHIKNSKASKEIPCNSRVNQEEKEVESMQIDFLSKIMRPIPTYSSTSLNEKPLIVETQKTYLPTTTQQSVCQPIFQECRQNYLVPLPISRPDEKRKCSCGGFKSNEKRKKIRPIINGYIVEGSLKVKGNRNKETILIPEDTYEVIPC